MLKVLVEIFEKGTIESNNSGERIPLHSNTTKDQGLFLQQVFDLVKPQKTLEVGFAYGISTLFILEKHKEINSLDKAHIVIEPDEYWGTAALHNIEKEGLTKYLKIESDFSDMVLTKLYHEKYTIQYAYIDTTKIFDVVLQDFYFIDKILEVGGVVILDDCGGGWPGVQRVARFINTLPHYSKLAAHNQKKQTLKKKLGVSILTFLFNILPFKMRAYPTIDFKTDKELGLDFSCIAFQKNEVDNRKWNWDKSF